MDQHLVAMTFLRIAMKKAQEIFKQDFEMLSKEDVAFFLTKFEAELQHEIFELLDKIIIRKLI